MAPSTDEISASGKRRKRLAINWVAVAAIGTLLSAFAAMVTAGAGIWRPPVPIPAIRVTWAGPKEAAGQPTPTVARTTPSAPVTTSVPPVVAADYVGMWTGSATSASGTYLPPTFAMTIHIRNGGIGAIVGDFTRDNPNCIGSLVLDTVTSSSITMSIPSGVEGGSFSGCFVGSQLVLSMESGSLGFQWFNVGAYATPIASATLAKQAQ
jgi:hypothetical protein